MTTHPSPAATPLASLVEALSGIIAQGRQQTLRAARRLWQTAVARVWSGV